MSERKSGENEDRALRLSGEMKKAAPLELEPGDFYWEGLVMVFTAQYHLRRGFCCNSGCRHCPYDEVD